MSTEYTKKKKNPQRNLTVDVEGVVVEAAVPHQPPPLAPAGRDVMTPILVQVLPKVASLVAAVLQQTASISTTCRRPTARA